MLHKPYQLYRSRYKLDSVKNRHGFQSNHEPNKTYKPVTALSLNNATSLTLTSQSPRKPVSDCISVPPYKSVHNSFIKPVHESS